MQISGFGEISITFNSRHSGNISLLKAQTFPPCVRVLPAGVLSVKASGKASSCDLRSPSPTGKCSAEATGAETLRLLNVSVARRTSAGCSPTARRLPVECRLLRSVWCQVRTDLFAECSVEGSDISTIADWT